MSGESISFIERAVFFYSQVNSNYPLRLTMRERRERRKRGKELNVKSKLKVEPNDVFLTTVFRSLLKAARKINIISFEK